METGRPCLRPVILFGEGSMLRKALALLVVAVMTAAAAPAAKAPAPKGRAATAKAAPAKPAIAPAMAGFDARDPASLVAALNAAGAKAQLGPRAEDTVLVAVTSAAADFSVQFVGCDRQGRACQAALYDSGPMAGTPNLSQLNGFNQSSALCRGFQDKLGKPHVVYSNLVFAGATRDQLRTQLAAWQGCIGDFRTFAKDPVGYLASAP